MSTPLAHCPKGKPIFGYNDNDEPVCYAHPLSPNGPCMSRLRMPNGRCRIHGGGTPASRPDEIISGRHASKAPQHLAETYERLLNDPSLLSCQKDVALAEARLEELASYLDLGWSPSLALWTIQQCLLLQETLELSGDPTEPQFLTLLEELLTRVTEIDPDAESRWNEIHRVTRYKSSLVKIEQAILVQQRLLITAEQANLIVNGIVQAMLNESASYRGRLLHLLDTNQLSELRTALKSTQLQEAVTSRVLSVVSDQRQRQAITQ